MEICLQRFSKILDRLRLQRGRSIGCALSILFLTAGCGGHAAPQHTATKPAPVPVKVTISAPTHRPKVNVPWPVTVRVTDPDGTPVAATLTMHILFNGTSVGTVDNGKVYRFVGTWRERKGSEITWPAASRGQPLAFEVIVKAKGFTMKRLWTIRVR